MSKIALLKIVSINSSNLMLSNLFAPGELALLGLDELIDSDDDET